jgi:hypothetical protein
MSDLGDDTSDDRALRAAVQAARRSLDEDSQGELPLPQRVRIWTAMGPILRHDGRALAGVGIHRRAALAMRCGLRVLPTWQRAANGNDLAERALASAKGCLRGQLSYEQGRAEFGQLWTSSDNLWGHGLPTRSVYAAYSAVKVLDLVLHDAAFDPEHIPDDVMDADLDPYGWDASFYASAAEASFSWEEDSDRERRRAFWRWYLDDAVPAAWRLEEPA